MTRPRPLADRLWEKVIKTDGCWEFTGSLMRGYGHMAVTRGHFKPAHRIAWELTNGPIPHGMLVCHRCDNRRCVRPDHLFLGTPKDNTQDMLRKNRQRKPIAKTHCRYGHEMTGGNVMWVTKRGQRRPRCRACAYKRHMAKPGYGDRKARHDALLNDPNLVISGSRETHCLHGHPLSGDNLSLVRVAAGQAERRCRTCLRLRARAYYKTRRAARAV